MTEQRPEWLPVKFATAAELVESYQRLALATTTNIKTKGTRACRGTNKSGRACRSVVVRADGYCPAHSPTHPTNLTEVGRQGGIKSGQARRQQREALQLLKEALNV